jgi:hypothetical protein
VQWLSVTLAIFAILWRSYAAEQAGSSFYPAPKVASELRVTVTVYNAAHVSNGELNRAEHEAGQIFNYAGIHLSWHPGLLGAEVTGYIASEPRHAPSLQLRIWHRTGEVKQFTTPDALGFCISFEKGEAVVLADAVRKHAVNAEGFSDLLGLAMAHELGHLLLRSDIHSHNGIMEAWWTQKELRDVRGGHLRFTEAEAASMRNEVSHGLVDRSLHLMRFAGRAAHCSSKRLHRPQTTNTMIPAYTGRRPVGLRITRR